MITHDLQQGTPEWHKFRAEHLNASDAPAMMGVSPYKTRTELLREKATGITADHDEATLRRFDDGHRFEALARPLAEKIVGQELYPAIGSEGKYAASFDGITMLEDVCFEHKTLNDEIRAAIGGEIPEHYCIQMEHQLMVSGASKCLFMASKWDGDTLIEKVQDWYHADIELRARIISGWEQFERDLAEYQHREIAEKPKAEAIMELPALFVQVKGEVTASNLREFKEAASTFIAAIKTDLQNDSDFANAEATVKFCKKAEENLDAAKKSALAQTVSIDELMRTVDHIQAQLREKRLLLDKLVKTEKDKRKTEMVSSSNMRYAEHIAGLQAEIAGIRMSLLLKTPDFGGAIKGLKSLASMHDALDTALANGKIEADAVAKDVRAKLEWCKENAAGYSAWFPDLQQLIAKPMDDFQLVITSRIEQAKAAEAAKLEAERARIQAEEEAKARAKVEAEAAEAKRKEEIAKHITQHDQLAKPASSSVEKQEVKPTSDKPRRPTNLEIIAVIEQEFGVSFGTACDWIASIAEEMKVSA